MKETSFAVEHKALSYVFAALVSLATLPLLGWHYIRVLSGLGTLAVAGLLLTDAILWTSSHWSVKVRSGLMKTVAIAVKLVLGAVMILNSGIVLMQLSSDRRTVETARLAGEVRAAEIAARAAAARELAGVTGGRAAARETMKLDADRTVETVTASESSALAGLVPEWYLRIGVFTVPPLAGLVGFGILTIAASVVRRRETLAELMGETSDTGDVSPALPGSTSMSARSLAPAYLRQSLPAPSKSSAATEQREPVRVTAEDSSTVSGSGRPDGLPVIPGIHYERTSKGGWEIWRGDGPRRSRQYVCYIGKKRLEGDRAELAKWIREKVGETA